MFGFQILLAENILLSDNLKYIYELSSADCGQPKLECAVIVLEGANSSFRSKHKLDEGITVLEGAGSKSGFVRSSAVF